MFNMITPKLRMADFTMSVMCLRGKLKRALLNNQHSHAPLDWTIKDFDCNNIVFQRSLLAGHTHVNEIPLI